FSRDWSADVCSSELRGRVGWKKGRQAWTNYKTASSARSTQHQPSILLLRSSAESSFSVIMLAQRRGYAGLYSGSLGDKTPLSRSSEERRGGKECTPG